MHGFSPTFMTISLFRTRLIPTALATLLSLGCVACGPDSEVKDQCEDSADDRVDGGGDAFSRVDSRAYAPLGIERSNATVRICPGSLSSNAVEVSLSGDGRVSVRDGGAWQPVSLDELRVSLLDSKKRFDEAESAAGGNGHQIDDYAGLLSRLEPRLDVAAGAPWGNLECVLSVFRVVDLYRFRLTVGNRKLSVLLPRRMAREGAVGPPRELTVIARAAGRVPRDWGAIRVFGPETIEFEVLDVGKSADIQEVSRFVSDVVRTADADGHPALENCALLLAPRTPAGSLIDILEVLRRHGLVNVDLVLISHAWPASAKASLLAYPKILDLRSFMRDALFARRNARERSERERAVDAGRGR